MKFFVSFLLITICSINWSQDHEFVGNWRLTSVFDTTGTKIKGIDKYKLFIKSDSTYLMDTKGKTSCIEGVWRLDSDKIQFDSRVVWDPCMEWYSDKSYHSYRFISKDEFEVEMYICGEEYGVSRFKRIK